jgi:RES domain-containing protein
VIPLPPPLGSGELVAWRLDQAVFAADWEGGEGAFRAGGRWNSRGVRAVYTSLDPATAILEVAVHKGFAALDTVPHVLTAATILDPSSIYIVQPEDVPNPNWLRPRIPGAGQQAFGEALLTRHPFMLIPSAVSSHSWNLIFIAAVAAGLYALRFQERFALDTRLHPPVRASTAEHTRRPQ